MGIPFIRHSALASLCLLASSVPTEGKRSETKVFTKIQPIRQLSAAEAARGFPVHVRAVVTHYDRGAGNLFIQDATAGIFVDSDKRLEIERGQEIELSGVTGPGE